MPSISENSESNNENSKIFNLKVVDKILEEMWRYVQTYTIHIQKLVRNL